MTQPFQKLDFNKRASLDVSNLTKTNGAITIKDWGIVIECNSELDALKVAYVYQLNSKKRIVVECGNEPFCFFVTVFN